MASPLGNNVFKGQSSAVANAKLSRAIRAVLADNEKRIVAEGQIDVPRALWNQATTPLHVVMLGCCVALLAAFAFYRVESEEVHPSIIVCVVLLLSSIGINAALVCVRLLQLRWEGHNRIVDAVLEFERACISFRPAVPTSPSPPTPGSLSTAAAPATVVTVDGLVMHAGSWKALDFHDPSKSMHTMPVFRDGEWVRLPVLLLVRGDLIALMGGEPAPAKGRCVDAGSSGRRSSMTALYRNFRVGQPEARSRRGASAGASSQQASQPASVPVAARRPEPLPRRTRDVEVLTLCGDMRRYALDDTPAAVALRKRLRTPHRPQPLFLSQLRSMERLVLLWQAGLGVAAVAAVVIRSVLTPSGAPDVHLGPTAAAAAAPQPQALVGVVTGLLVQVPTLLLCVSPLTFSTMLALSELILTASVLAAYELALLRFKWKAWKRRVDLQMFASDKLEEQKESAAARSAAQDAVAAGTGGVVEQRSRHNQRRDTDASLRELGEDSSAFSAEPRHASASQWAWWEGLLRGWRGRTSAPDTGVGQGSAAAATPVAVSSPAGYSLHPFIVDGDATTAAAVASDPPPPSGAAPATLRASDDDGTHRNEGIPTVGGAVGLPNAPPALVAMLSRASSVCDDIGGVSLDGEYVPRAYAERGATAVGFPALLSDDLRREFNVRSAVLASTSHGLPSSRRFDGVSLSRIIAHWSGPSEVRVLFYLRRLCCLCHRRTQLVSATPVRLPQSSAAKNAHGVAVVSSGGDPRRSRQHNHQQQHQSGIADSRARDWTTSPDLPARTTVDSQRWGNTFFSDALVDVGFGMSPIATPLVSSQILLRLGSATVFCCADRSTVSDPDPVVENVLLLKVSMALARRQMTCLTPVDLRPGHSSLSRTGRNWVDNH